MDEMPPPELSSPFLPDEMKAKMNEVPVPVLIETLMAIRDRFVANWSFTHPTAPPTRERRWYRLQDPDNNWLVVGAVIPEEPMTDVEQLLIYGNVR